MRAWSICVLAVLPLLAGCRTHVSLLNNSIRTTEALTDLNCQQVLDNVAQFVADPSTMPPLAVFDAGTATVADRKPK